MLYVISSFDTCSMHLYMILLCSDEGFHLVLFIKVTGTHWSHACSSVKREG